MSLPRAFHEERRRVAEATGPGVLTGVTTARIGNDHVWRSVGESPSDFTNRLVKMARQRGVEFVPYEGLLHVSRR